MKKIATIPARRGAATALILLATSLPALAHGAEAGDAADNWNTWALTPDLVIPTVLIAAIYLTGFLRRGKTEGRFWLHAAFWGGLASIFLALASPIDGIADRLFWMHQIQHMLLRMIGPMLMVLAAPQGVLISGLPRGLRRGVLAPLLTNNALRSVFAWLTGPIVVTVLFVAALCVWEYPPFHNEAVLNDGVHYVMHVTMLAAGFLFWWRVFDARPGSVGTPYGIRLMMLWVATMANIALGAYTTLKGEALYTAYGAVSHAFDTPALADEMIGGFIIWVPSSMMCLLAVLIVINRWGHNETHVDAEARRLSLAPTTGAALVAGAQARNRGLAIGFSVFVLSMFAGAILIGVLTHLAGPPDPLIAHAVP